MSKVADLSYDIQELYIEGLSAKRIAAELNCPIDHVLAVLESFSVADTPQEDYSPFDTMNS
jgi:orotate phosphoribosyltransferase-like protein